MSSHPGSSKPPDNPRRSPNVTTPGLKKQGILKNPKTARVAQQNTRLKSASFDEKNIRETLHPPNKDYGFMKIEEPKTPYRRHSDEDNDAEALDPTALKNKLLKDVNLSLANRIVSVNSFSSPESSRSDDIDFSKHRKMHYSMREQLRLGRELANKEFEDSDSD